MDWIKKSDITDKEFLIKVLNNTTDIVIPTSQPIELVEISKKSVHLSVPTRSCAAGQLLTVGFLITERLSWGLVDSSAKKKPQGLEVSVTARIDEETALDKGYKIIRLTLLQYDVEQWGNLIKEVEIRQQKLNQIVEKIRE